MNSQFKLWFAAAALAVTAAAPATAKTISPDEALARLRTEDTPGVVGMPASQASQMKLAYTMRTASGIDRPAIYVFSNGNAPGFCITPADDAFPALLGFSATSSFDSTNISPEFKWWLSQYESEMEWMKANGMTYEAPADDSLGAAINPLMTTLWNQNQPFNDLTPTINGVHTMTGCGATAMAQVIKYHNYPAKAKGYITYKWENEKKNLSLNLATVPLDWDNMIDNYNYSYTPEQGTAVANLMKACGYSLSMNYGLYASGASSYAFADALRKYFDYDPAAHSINRNFMSLMEWERSIYAEIAAKRPVIITGQSPSGGHAFVCDGYQGNHFFHINWGWGGYQDGYFLLSMLNPASGGIGGSAGGYNSLQTAVLGIKPNAGGKLAPAEVYCNGDFGYGGVDESDGSLQFVATYENGGYFYNLSSQTFVGNVGIIVEQQNGKSVDYPYDFEATLKPGEGVGYIPVASGNKPAAGKYNIYPAYRTGTTGALSKMPVREGCNPYIVMTVDDAGKVTFANAPVQTESPEIKVVSFTVKDQTVYSKYPVSVNVGVQNLSKATAYTGAIFMQLVKDNQVEATRELYAALWPEETFNVQGAVIFSVEAGEYEVRFTDNRGNQIGSGYNMTIVDGKPSDLYSHVKIMGIWPTEFQADNEYTLRAQIFNDYAADIIIPVTIRITDTNGSTVREFTINRMEFPASSNLTYEINGFPTSFGKGKFFMSFLNETHELSEPFEITVGDPATAISLGKSEVEIEIEKSYTFTPEITPADAVVNLTWKSSNPNVATVNGNGTVLALKKGTAEITVTDSYSNLSAKCTVKVIDNASVSAIESEGAVILSVTDAAGNAVADVRTAAELRDLPAGIYIVRTDKGTYKVVR